jgi:hypothetical protein
MEVELATLLSSEFQTEGFSTHVAEIRFSLENNFLELVHLLGEAHIMIKKSEFFRLKTHE